MTPLIILAALALQSSPSPDITGDGIIDGADQGALFGAWGWEREPLTDTAHPADLNADGKVDGADYGLLQGAWGTYHPITVPVTIADAVHGALVEVPVGARLAPYNATTLVYEWTDALGSKRVYRRRT